MRKKSWFFQLMKLVIIYLNNRFFITYKTFRIIMKHPLIFLLLFISSISFSQTNSGKPNGNSFTSVFQNITSGNFNGTINGVLIIKDDQNKKSLLDFQGSNASLTIEEDIDKVYDVSFKRYTGTTTSGKTEINYNTYAYANGLRIKLKDEYYRLTFFRRCL